MACFCEMFLKPQDNFSIPNYTTYLTDRTNQRGGGTAMPIKNNITHIIDTQLHSIETTTLIVQGTTNKFHISACYRQGKNKIDERDLDVLLPNGWISAALRYFNAKNPTWNFRTSNRDGLLLQKYADSHPATKIHAPTEPTIYHNNTNTQPDIIDTVITKNLHSHTEIYALNELSSDHLPVLFTLEEKLTTARPYPRKTDYNWKKFKTHLGTIPHNNFLETKEHIDQEATCLQKQIYNVLKTHQKTNSYSPKYYKLPQSIIEIIKNRNQIKHLFQKTRLLTSRDNETT